MSADLVVYAVAPSATDAVRDALDVVLSESVIGDDWEPGEVEDWTKQGVRVLTWTEFESAWDLIRSSSAISRQWVGQVSWLKAGLLDDNARYVPGVVRAINTMLAEPRVLTPGLRSQMMVAFNLPDRSIYSTRYRRRHHNTQAPGGAGRNRARRPYPGGRRDAQGGVVKPRHFRTWADEHIGWTLYAMSE